MALVAFLRGVNVGGHRSFRPTRLANDLRHLDAVNIGAAGTLVIRRRISRAQLRTEIASRLPFDTGIMICRGGDVADLHRRNPFAGQPSGPDTVRFVCVLARRPRALPPLPLYLPSRANWLVKVHEYDAPFVLGLYRRQMRAIACLGQLDRRFEVPLTTRNWNTIGAIAGILGATGATS